MAYERGEAAPATHVISVGFSEYLPNPDNYTYIYGREALRRVETDEANFPGGSANYMVAFTVDAMEEDFSEVIKIANEASETIVAVGPQTSLTGASVPRGDVVLDMFTNRDRQSEIMETDTGFEVTVQSGVTFKALQENLHSRGLFLPAAVTEDEASVVGSINTNGGGARSYKYGKMNRFVTGLTMILGSGEILKVRRGQFKAHPGDEQSPGGYFELWAPTGYRRIPVPSYTAADVSKASTGYNSGEEIDLIDLIASSEGTLGVITEATVKVLEEPKTSMLLVPCESDEKAMDLLYRLDGQEHEKRTTLAPGGISAVEIIGSSAAQMVREKGTIVEKVSGRSLSMPEGSAFLLVQIEEGDQDSLALFEQHCLEAGVSVDGIYFANHDDQQTKRDLIAIRESVPKTVNAEIRKYKEMDAAVTKVGADPCVKPEYMPAMMTIYAEEFAAAGVDYYWWGHGEGNIHYNALPQTSADVEKAKVAVLRAGMRVIKELNGVGTAEHGVGKNILKQLLLLTQYGRQGFEEMLNVKKAFDPDFMLAHGNIIDLLVLDPYDNIMTIHGRTTNMTPVDVDLISIYDIQTRNHDVLIGAYNELMTEQLAA